MWSCVWNSRKVVNVQRVVEKERATDYGLQRGKEGINAGERANWRRETERTKSLDKARA